WQSPAKFTKNAACKLCSLSEISVKLRFWRGVYGQILKI
ncbi:unnamed protein product, partial [Brassica oleracea var. botrytis]